MPINDNECVAVRVYTKDQEQGAVNTFHFFQTSHVGAGVSYQDVANAFDASLAALFGVAMYNGAVYSGVGVKSATALPRQVEAFSIAGAQPGSAGALGMARQTAGLVRATTGFTGRTQRGRAYIPFPATADDNTFGQPSAAYLLKLTAIMNVVYAVNNIVVGANSGVLFPCIFHRRTGAFSGITLSRFGLGWATQRRRGSYGRPNVNPI